MIKKCACGKVLTRTQEILQVRCLMCRRNDISLYLKKNPWRTAYTGAKTRCNYASHPSYHKYGGVGIKFLLTMAEMKKLWERDQASKMQIPSIDRKDSRGNYTFDNCRFLERDKNSSLKKNNKLTPEKVKQIQALRGIVGPQKIAIQFGISEKYASAVQCGSRAPFRWDRVEATP